MILLGQIEKVVSSDMKDKQSGQVSRMHQLVISDKTKPSQFRTNTFFVTYLGEDKFKALFNGADPVDEKVTVAVSEMAPMNAMMKVKGQVLVGHFSGERLLAMVTEEAAAASASPAPKTPAVPSK